MRPDPTSETVLEFADQLRQYAEHFEQHDWDYTRRHRIKRIREAGDFSGYDRIDRRCVRTIEALCPLLTKHGRANRDTALGKMTRGWRYKLALAKVQLLTDRHLPDGVLDNGRIVTHWEEHGEYLQYVQPSVGSMLADWLEAEPNNPHALQIAGEMRRINDRYGEQIAAEGPDS